MRWVLAGIGVAVVAIAVAVSFMGGDDSKPSAAVAPPTGATGCTNAQAQSVLAAIGPSANILSDSADRLRVALVASDNAELTADLAEGRQMLAAATVDSCGSSIKSDLLAAYDAEIDGLMKLSARSSDEAAAQFEAASAYLDRATASIQTIVP